MSEKNQDTKKKHGGPRPGSGRPKHSRDKLKVTDFFSPEDKDRLVEVVRKMVLDTEKPDKEMTKFLWEQIFGKATQRTELTGAEGEALQIVFDQVFNDK